MTPAELYERVSPSIPLVETPHGLGSGVLIDGGYIVTNYHVVWPDVAVRVVFPDGTEFENLPVVGWDPMSDLALLGPVDVPDPPLRLEDGEHTPIGTQLFLIGYPGEVDRFPEPTITSGVLSNVREWEMAGITFLQTDSSIASGQSGGALVNAKGQVIGISGFTFSEAKYPLVASAADIAPIIGKLVEGESPFGLGQRRLRQGHGGTNFDIELRNFWATREFVFEAEEGSVIQIEMEGEGDGKFSISTPFERILEVDDGASGVERATTGLPTGGLHFLQVEMATGEPSTFQLASNVDLRLMEDPDDGRPIRAGDTIAASLDHPRDWDWYSIELRAGDTVKISANSLNVDTLMYVDFPGSDASETVSDDDSGGGLFGTNSELVYRAPHSGEYLVVITEAVDGNHGGYFLSVEIAPEDASLTIHTPTSAESERLANLYYGCLLSNKKAREAFLSAITATIQEDGVARDEARAMAESILESGELFVSLMGLGIQVEGVSGLEELLGGHCDDLQPPGQAPAPTPEPGSAVTLRQYFQGHTLHISVADLERAPELRYSTTDANQVVRRWSLLPSVPGNELVLVRLKVENHTIDNAALSVDGDAAMLRASDGASYRPISVSETVWRDFRGGPEPVALIDQGQCFDGVGALIDAGTTVRWQSEADPDHYLDSLYFLDGSIDIGPDGRAELGPGVSTAHTFSELGIYPYVCVEVEHSEEISINAERLAKVRVMPPGEQGGVAERKVLFLDGWYGLEKGYGLDGYLVFDVPEGREFHVLEWTAGDDITIPLDAHPVASTPDDMATLGHSAKQWSSPPPMTIDPAASYTALLNTAAGTITVELLVGEAPNTVNNFVFLARQGFYDNVIFHRTIEGFMIQGGDPTGTGAGGPGYQFADEQVQRPYSRGVMAMANAGPDTNGSQFFIMHADYPLPPNYTIFGQTVSGLETVDAIATAPTQPGGEGSTPVNPVIILSVKIVSSLKSG